MQKRLASLPLPGGCGRVLNNFNQQLELIRPAKLNETDLKKICKYFHIALLNYLI